ASVSSKPVAMAAPTMAPADLTKKDATTAGTKTAETKPAKMKEVIADRNESDSPDTTLTTASVTPASPDERVVSASAAYTPAPVTASASTDIPAQVGPLALREAAQNGDAKALYVVGSRLAEGAGLASDMQ